MVSSSKSWQSLPMILLSSLVKQHAGDLKAAFLKSPNSNQSSWEAKVPLDIIIEIAEKLNSVEDLLSLSLTVRRFALTLRTLRVVC
jgi:hypothetical protein